MISDFFTKDHEEIAVLLGTLAQRLEPGAAEPSAGAPSTAELGQEVHRRLRRHIEWEEELLFPAVEAKSGDLADGPGRVMRIEHQEILAHLQALENLLAEDATSERARQEGRGVLNAIEAILEEHNEKEEGIYYPLCDQLLGDPEVVEIMGKLERWD